MAAARDEVAATSSPWPRFEVHTMTGKAAPKKLTTQELAVMKVVWRLGQATVREVHDALQQARPLAYTTVLTMMRILEGKGFLRRDDSAGRAHVYTPTRSQAHVVGTLVRDFVERVFDGAAHPLVMHLVNDRQLTDDERIELARMLESADTPRPRGRKGEPR